MSAPATTGTVPPRTRTSPTGSPSSTNVRSVNPSNPKFNSVAASEKGSPSPSSTMLTSRRSPRSATAITQNPAPNVSPVFAPIAPGYSHRRTFRFCTTRGGPVGAGIVANFVATIGANPFVS